MSMASRRAFGSWHATGISLNGSGLKTGGRSSGGQMAPLVTAPPTDWRTSS